MPKNEADAAWKLAARMDPMCRCGHPESAHETYGVGKPQRWYNHADNHYFVAYPEEREHCIHC
ncbi:MAG TPA: hypothetical protein VFZ61_10330, partial [Polyangiales bacterium]